MYYKWNVLHVFFIGLFFQVSARIVVTRIDGIDSALLGKPTTLTCKYKASDETGVVVAWFFNKNTQIAEWISDSNVAQSMGPFKDILLVNNTSITFKETTANLTGNYKCKVSSNNDDASRTKAMIVYQPPENVFFSRNKDSKRCKCSVFNVYPKPTITITGSHDSGELLMPLGENTFMTTFLTEDTLYNITKEFEYDNGAIKHSATFTCNIRIPNTSYNSTSSLFWEKMD